MRAPRRPIICLLRHRCHPIALMSHLVLAQAMGMGFRMEVTAVLVMGKAGTIMWECRFQCRTLRHRFCRCRWWECRLMGMGFMATIITTIISRRSIVAWCSSRGTGLGVSTMVIHIMWLRTITSVSWSNVGNGNKGEVFSILILFCNCWYCLDNCCPCWCLWFLFADLRLVIQGLVDLLHRECGLWTSARIYMLANLL